MKTTTPPGPWLLTDEAADYLKMHRKTICTLLDRRDIRGVKVGKTWRTKAAWLDEYLMKGAY